MFTTSPPFWSSGAFQSTYTRLLGTFPGSSLADQSMYAIGNATQTNGTVYDGYYEATHTDASYEYIEWRDASLEIQNSTPWTIEFLFKAVEVTTDPASSTQVALINVGTHDVLVNIDGLIGGKNKLFIGRYVPGWSYTTPDDIFDSAVHHIAIVLKSTGNMDMYYDGTRQLLDEPYTKKSPPYGFGFVQLGLAGGAVQNVTIEHRGVRIRSDAFYSGASFTPPTVLEEVAP